MRTVEIIKNFSRWDIYNVSPKYYLAPTLWAREHV
jgi:hypothetical protein